ncbi:hypothetical protein RHGRI_023029 [Rhododendron griersonianum]|uniref:Uncharacterized protein n=1 Tax=Rhododendron griersonianum TaxID=479676 RepID=A0AAV6J5C8_9ERIC|nr:hypothetical protein RHGRI_023029 [Rhododendron griersonianum]
MNHYRDCLLNLSYSHLLGHVSGSYSRDMLKFMQELLKVDGQFQTGVLEIFAIGDVAAFPLKGRRFLVLSSSESPVEAPSHWMFRKPSGIEVADDNYSMGNFRIDSGVIYLIEHAKAECLGF